MTKRAQITFAGLVAMLALAYPASLGLTPRHRITSKNAQRIKAGMTLPEVEAIFGVLAGDYSEGPSHMSIWQEHEGFPPGSWSAEWRAEHTLMQVYFDSNNTVLVASGCSDESPPWYERIKRWFGL